MTVLAPGSVCFSQSLASADALKGDFNLLLERQRNSICETPKNKKITMLPVLSYPESRGPKRDTKFVYGYKIVIVWFARPGFSIGGFWMGEGEQ